MLELFVQRFELSVRGFAWLGVRVVVQTLLERRQSLWRGGTKELRWRRDAKEERRRSDSEVGKARHVCNRLLDVSRCESTISALLAKRGRVDGGLECESGRLDTSVPFARFLSRGCLFRRYFTIVDSEYLP